MSSPAHGSSISVVEVANISAHGIWLLFHDQEMFMSYDDFPWFKEQTVKTIINVEEQSPGHFYWPDLDVDLTEEIIKYPDSFPVKSKIT